MHVPSSYFPRLLAVLALSLFSLSNLYSQEDEAPKTPVADEPVVATTPAPKYPDVWASVETVYARLYFDVKVLSTDPQGITFRHRGGIAKLPYERFFGPFRDQFMEEEAQWAMARDAMAEAMPVKETNFPAYQAAPAPSIIVIQVQNQAPPCPPTPCGYYGTAPIVTYPSTANLPCNLRTWRKNSLSHLLYRTQALKLRPFGANARFFTQRGCY